MSSYVQHASEGLPSLETIQFDDLSRNGSEDALSTRPSFDAEVFRATARTFVELQDYDGTDLHGTVEVLLEERPDIASKFDAHYIEQIVILLFESEIPKLSQFFEGLYRRFNAAYFGGRLLHYRVRVVFDLRTFAAEPILGGVSSGLVRFDERCIYLRYTESQSMDETLIHEMAHAATGGDYGGEWLAEMRRLKDAGAPVPDWLLEELPLADSDSRRDNASTADGNMPELRVHEPEARQPGRGN